VLSVVLVNEVKDLTEGLLVDVLKFLIDSDCLDDILVSFPDYLEFVLQLFDFLFLFGLKAREDNGGTGFFVINIGKRTDKVDVFMQNIFLQNGLELSVSVMLKHVLEGLEMLALS
jgi:hypothetical protein